MTKPKYFGGRVLKAVYFQVTGFLVQRSDCLLQEFGGPSWKAGRYSLLDSHALSKAEALSKGPKTLGKAFVEGCLRQRPLKKFLDGKRVFNEGPLSGTQQSLCRGPRLAIGKEKQSSRRRHC